MNSGPRLDSASAPGRIRQTAETMSPLQVLEYLNKKGFSRSEAMLRRESAHTDADGRPIVTRVEHAGGSKYPRAFSMILQSRFYPSADRRQDLLRSWIEDNLDVYKVSILCPPDARIT